MITTLGWSYLDSNGTVMPQAVNRYGALRAQYVAESGAAMALHWLMYPPTSVALTSYYTGGTGVAIDSSSDYTDVTVTRSDSWSPAQNDPNLYRITAVGVARNADGTVRGKQSVSADVVVPPNGRWQLPYALLATSSVSVPSTVSIYGDIMSNGALTGSGWCQGRVSSSGSSLWSGAGSVTSVTSSVTAPSLNPATYWSYTLRGTTYSAYSYSSGNMNTSNATALNAINMTATNPGRFIRMQDGTGKIQSAVTLSGTLLVNGDLELDTSNIHINALNNFPAVVVNGDLKFTRDNASAYFQGAVLVRGGITDSYKSAVVLDVTGATVIGGNFSLNRSDGSYRLRWDRNASTFWDVQHIVTQRPATILNWKDN